MAGEDISEVAENCIACTYHPMFFWKIKKIFELWSTKSKISTLTLAYILGFTVLSTNIKTQKNDGLTLKLFNMVQVKDMLGKTLNLKKFTSDQD